MVTAGVVVVAGLSSRMGSFKPLLPISKDLTIIERTVYGMLDSGVDHVIVVLGFRGKEIEDLLRKRKSASIEFVYNDAYQTSDMMTSVQIGLQRVNLAAVQGVFILPGDIPEIKKGTYTILTKMMELTDCQVIRPTIEGAPKHPPFVSKEVIPYLIDFNGDGGLRVALKNFEEKTVHWEVDDFGCSIDVDTPEEYQLLLKYCETLVEHK